MGKLLSTFGEAIQNEATIITFMPHFKIFGIFFTLYRNCGLFLLSLVHFKSYLLMLVYSNKGI